MKLNIDHIVSVSKMKLVETSLLNQLGHHFLPHFQRSLYEKKFYLSKFFPKQLRRMYEVHCMNGPLQVLNLNLFSVIFPFHNSIYVSKMTIKI